METSTDINDLCFINGKEDTRFVSRVPITSDRATNGS